MREVCGAICPEMLQAHRDFGPPGDAMCFGNGALHLLLHYRVDKLSVMRVHEIVEAAEESMQIIANGTFVITKIQWNSRLSPRLGATERCPYVAMGDPFTPPD